MHKDKNSGGFVLIELLLGIAILGIAMAAIFGALTPSIKSYNFSLSKTNSVQAARTALASIEDTVRYAASIDTPALGGSGNELDFKDGAGNAFVISVPTSGTNANTIVITRGGTVVSKLAAGMIQPDPQNPIFFRDATDAGKLTIKLTVNDNAYAGSPSTTLTSLIMLANL